MTTTAHFPPAGYFWSVNSRVTTRDRDEEVQPISGKVFFEDGVSTLRYQTSNAPIEVGSLLVDGVLRSTDIGELLDGDGKLVGSVDFETGIFEIDIGKSPDLGSRAVRYVFPRAEPLSV